MKELVSFDNVSKYYHLGTGTNGLLHLGSRVASRVTGQPVPPGGREGFWALREISFCVRQGDALGIIGSNGAGKTTTLKILSRVTKPTSGRATVKGRMSSLIELGAGFHPDLSGRENVYLNGAILGLKKHEIDALFDRIVAFSELEPFIDTPVKRYSSGMYARLGFAVAAHVNPEVLLVDEVLSVGDVGFQAKCAERMKELRRQGTSVIFVSHNMRSVNAICDSCLLLNHGQVEYLGPPREAIDRYLSLNRVEARGVSTPSGVDGVTFQPADILCVELLDETREPKDRFRIGDTVVARIHYVAHQRIEAPLFSAGLFRVDGLHACSNTSEGYVEPNVIEGPGVIELVIPHIALVPNTYILTTSISERKTLRAYAMEQSASFQVASDQRLIDEHYGVFVPDFRWREGGDNLPNESRLMMATLDG